MRVYFVFMIIVLASCASKKKLAEFEELPGWIRKKPVDAGYYVGVGSAKKVGTPLQYSRAAKEDALADLASEIATQISSTSVLRTIETEYGNTQLFNQRIETRSSDYLEGFEPVDAYETDEEYWVYYRIGIEEYLEAKARKKEAAVSAALVRYKAGLAAENALQFVESLRFYLKGLQALRAYLQEDTPVDLEGRPVDLGNELYTSLSRLTNGLSIEEKQPAYTVKRGKEVSEEILFFVSHEGQPVQNMPVEFTFSGGYLSDNRATTGKDGRIALSPGVIRSKNSTEIISATLDIERVAREAVDDLFIRGLVNNADVESAKVTLVIEPVRVILELDGPCESLPCNELKNAFEEVVRNERFYPGRPGASDYIFKVTFRIKSGSRAGGLNSVFLDGGIEVVDELGNARWTKQLEPIQGVGKTENVARDKAFRDFILSLQRIWIRTGLDMLD